MDLEYRAISALTRNLPPVRGMGTLANALVNIYCRKPRQEITVNNDGICLELAPGESVNQNAMAFFPKLQDRAEQNFIRQKLRPGDTFLDIGAHVGSFAMAAARLVGEAGRVIAVEAFPPTYQRLLRNIELNAFHNVTAFNLGVSDQFEVLKLGVKPDNSGCNSFLRPTKTTIDVECKPLLDILQNAKVDEVAMLKIDVEGFEVRVLKRFFADAPREIWPGHIVMEKGHKFAKEGDPVALVTDQGYRLVEQHGMNYMLSLPSA